MPAFSFLCVVEIDLVWCVLCRYQLRRKLATAFINLKSESFDYTLGPQWEFNPELHKILIHLATYVRG